MKIDKKRGNYLYRKYFKRILDIIFSFMAIIILLPLNIIIATIIKVEDRGPVFFRQKRIAKNENGKSQYFQIYKYRTMTMFTPQDTPTHLLEQPERYITKFGSVLRKTYLDEIPQIINIFLGQMSIVGPRPALWNQEDLYIEREKYGANDILPGLTGLAQIRQRGELPIEEKAEIDGYYVKHMSFFMDVQCVLGTIIFMIRGEGWDDQRKKKHKEYLSKNDNNS